MSHIKTFARLKPGAQEELYDDFEIAAKKTFSLRVPELQRDYGLQSSKSRYPTISYDFRFDHVFDTASSQEEVYTLAARDIVSGFLDGYNGTIFAYGQTGTGKTYTVEGSPLRYSDRGLAPRALAEIYKSLEKREDEEISLHISYLEIYQEVAYDLLSTTARTSSPVTVFPRVNVAEGSNGTCMIRNLSVHLAPSEDVASALLMQGQANRKVAETPVNQRSSRSHAVFTIYLTTKKQESDIIRRSKLHLVDLAGSERVAKTGVDGQQLTEAKSINLSLHYLESVIIALQADSAQNRPRSTHSSNSRGNISLGGRSTYSESPSVKRHVPYRNSVLTMVLRDSLGGNCLTSMIATISLEVHNLGETLSTCRFAQRVACISNHARRNEEIDDKTLIQQLRRRIAELETQMACLRLTQPGQNADNERREEEETASKLTDEDKLSCAQVVQEYLAGRVSDPVTAGITNPFKFRECLRILKRMVMSRYFQDRLAPSTPLQAGEVPASSAANHSRGQGSHGSGVADNGRGVVEVRGNAQILRLEETATAGDSQDNVPAQSAMNGVMDTDELILNIQRLYAASRREQRGHQQSASQERSTTPPRAVVRTESYKSPFERKREKEIRKLSRRLDGMKKTQSEQEQQLQELRTSTAFGELSNMESIIRNKIQVTREQIADQHAYRLHLRHTEASPEVLQQEKMVEDQLIKREAKFQKKLDEVLQKKREMEAQVTQGDTPEGKSSGEGQDQAKLVGEKRSLEEQFSQYKKRNGTLNTRQVYDMLKSEEKKHVKATHQAETEKKFLMTKQLAMKEEATREKLRELKEMMRKSQEEALLGQSFQPDPPLQAPDHRADWAQPYSAWGQDTQVVDLEGQDLDRTFVVEGSSEGRPMAVADGEKAEARRTGDAFRGKSPSAAEGRVVENETASHSHHHHHHHQPSSGAPSRSSSKVELKWESVYSRPSTSNSTRSAEWVDPRQQSSPSGVPVSAPSRATCSSSSDGVKGEERNGGRTSSNSNGSGSSFEIRSDYPKPSRTSPHGSNSPQVTENHHHLSQHHHLSVGQRERNVSEDSQGDSPTVMPSEYVRGINGKDKFDARKMGLSSKTFDSALSSMLNDEEESKAFSYGFEYYDKYARESKPPVKKSTYSRSSERTTLRSHRSPEQRSSAATTDSPATHAGKAHSSWGPEAKNSSVASRLAQFLSEDKDSKSLRSRTDTSVSAKTTKSVSFLERLTQLHEEEMTNGAGVVSPRIQAMQDTQRESTYVGRIQAEKERVARIRQARQAAEAIQRAWRRHCRNSK